ncbi:hypothetical protein, partial [Mycobacterium marinum]
PARACPPASTACHQESSAQVTSLQVNNAGTLTGVSPRPDDAVGEQYVTITGVINGPTVNEYTVYGRMAVDVDQWPSTGQVLPVVYSPKNPDNWNFALEEPPED